MYRAWGGNYAVSRSDWSDTAVEVTLLGGPVVGSIGNGKPQFNSGSITIQRGNNRLLVYGIGEASRAYDIISHTTFYNQFPSECQPGNKKNSIFWAGASLSETANQGYHTRALPPGYTDTVAAWGSSIDRAEDTTFYTYWRASGLEANNDKSAIDKKYHQVAWTREVFFLRPKLVIVHDRTTVLNNGDDRAMFWVFGRNISAVTNGVSSGVTRYDAAYQGVYRGAFWSVLPAAPSSVSVVDHDDLHFLYRVEVRPAANDHRNDNWLVVLDAADSVQNVNTVTPLTATNADSVQFNDTNRTVVAFPQSDPPTLPMTIQLTGQTQVYVAGMSASTNYKITASSTSVTISADDGTHRVASSATGILAILNQ